MTQPPDPQDPRPDDAPVQPPPAAPSEPSAADDQPTVAWSPPPAAPAEAAAPPPSGSDVPPPAPPLAPAASPIISATPATAAGVEPTDPATAPLVGWAVPAAPAVVATRDGFVIGGVGARLVAFLIDLVLVGIVPLVLQFTFTDYGDTFRDLAENAGGQTAVTIPVTTDLILLTLLGIGISFLYFVGLWTSGLRATIGMRIVGLQVADAASGQTLSLTAAIKRWAAMGEPLNLLTLIPGLASIVGLAEFAVYAALFLTTVTNDRKQGFHDRFAESLVIRPASKGDGSTAFGCVVLALLVIVAGIVLSVLVFNAMAPYLDEIMTEIGNSI